MPSLIIRFIGHVKDGQKLASYAVFNRINADLEHEILRETKVPCGEGIESTANWDALHLALQKTFTGLTLAGIDPGKLDITVENHDKDICEALRNVTPHAKKSVDVLKRFSLHFVHWKARSAT